MKWMFTRYSIYAGREFHYFYDTKEEAKAHEKTLKESVTALSLGCGVKKVSESKMRKIKKHEEEVLSKYFRGVLIA